MELNNAFTIALPVEEAWALLTDLERIAPCMPGAELHEVDGAEHRGVVKVKVGPIVAKYQGVATIREQDEVARRAVVRAEGRDTRGQGNAAATITVTLAPEGTGTHVDVHTDLSITGKVAQFGRGVLADVSRKLMGQFAEALEARADADAEAGTGSGTGAAAEAETGTAAQAGVGTETGTGAETGTRTGTGADAETGAAAGAGAGVGTETGDGPGAGAGAGAGVAAGDGAAAEVEGGAGAWAAAGDRAAVEVGGEGGAGADPGTDATAATDEPAAGGPTTARRSLAPVPAEPVDLLAVSGASLFKRLGPVVAVLVALLILRRLVGG